MYTCLTHGWCSSRQMCPICSGQESLITGKVDTIEEQLKAANGILRTLVNQSCTSPECACHIKLFSMKEWAVEYMERWGVPK